MSPDELVAAARAWRDEDPDADDRAEVDRLLAALEAGDSQAIDELRERFGAGLSFGTAGLRGAMGAGPNRMNRAVVIRATAGLAAYLHDTGHAGEAVVVGYDARHRSTRMAADAAAVLVAAGFTVHLADRPLPTPVIAFGVLHLGAAAGIVVFAGAYLVALPFAFSTLIALPILAKAVIAIVLIAPLAFLMGLPFPLGLSRVSAESPGLVPWAWAINGCASVVGAVLAGILAIHFGFTAVVCAALILYTVAAAVFTPRAA